ncbi:MAG: aspartate carbamoyltransferase regulatory subunit, partial [Thermoplasmata archaeon]|nr:aspartate carbamoyltransferase regulatory subunit [Thermoplasmata archaeon]
MRELKITPIKNGTVIDHIGNGLSLEVLRIIGVRDLDKDSTVSVAPHVR